MAIQSHVDTASGAPEGRPVLGGAYAACAALGASSPERLWALTDDEVAGAMRLLGVLSASVDAHLVAVLAEAKRRSLGRGEGWGPFDWARSMAPNLSTRALADLDTVADAAASGELRVADVVEAVLDAAAIDAGAVDAGAVDSGAMGASGSDGTSDGTGAGPAGGDGEPGDPREALPVGKAAQILRFHSTVRGLADPMQLEEVTALLLRDARGPGGLKDKELAVAVKHASNLMRPDRLVERDADLRRAHRSLVKSAGPVGMWRYTMLLDEEGAAIVDAAVDALAKPQPDPETGEPDPRTPHARRADALLDLVRRAVGAPEGVPRQAKTSLVVTIGLAVLQGACRGAGLTMAGEILTTDTVRRLACDAQVIPVVLGSRGEVLEQGRAERLFTRAQIRHLWLRDRHCTFPGCSKPAAWTDGHHLIHWADDGPTDIWNAALLCQAHHTVVHRDRCAGRVVDGPQGPTVHWDLTPGSYDVALAAWRAAGCPSSVGDTRGGGDAGGPGIAGPDRRPRRAGPGGAGLGRGGPRRAGPVIGVRGDDSSDPPRP